MRPCRRHGRIIGFWICCQAAKETLRLVQHSCSEVDLVRIGAGIAGAGNKRPEITDGDRGTVGAKQLAEEMIVLRIEDIDRTVTKIPDQKIVGELAKSRRCDRKPPRRIERPAGCHSVQHMPLQVELIHEAVGGTGAVYKGLAIGQTDEGTFLYAANFRNGTVDVFDQNFNQVNSFTDRHVPAGYAPFNVQVLDNHLFVTFALQDDAKHDDVAGPGHGFVDEFDLQGHLLDRVASRGPLDSPWGLAIAPSGFGEFANDLLVGNFGDGTINVFDPKNDHFLGKLLGADGAPITIGDLWALIPGTGSAGSDPNNIYFTAGVQNEAHGLFGSLAAIPETDQSAVSMPSGTHHPMHG